MRMRLFSGARREKGRYMLLLCAVCLAINVLGDELSTLLNLPLYLDVIGTVLSAALGGLIPGILVGFLTNLIKSFASYENWYYGSLSVLIAICTSFFAGREYFRKPQKWPVMILAFTLIGGGLGSVLTWFLYDFSFGQVRQSAALAQSILDSGRMNEFWSELSADILVDLLDKTVTVLLAALVLHILPEKLREKLFYSGWHQKPLSAKALAKENRKFHRRSLRTKVILVVALATLITGVAVTVISVRHFRDASIDNQKKLAEGTVKVIAQAIAADEVDGYLGENGEENRKSDNYKKAETIMQSLMDSSDYIQYCYAYRILPDGCHVVFDPEKDENGEYIRPAGYVDDFDPAFDKYRQELLNGKKIDDSVTSYWEGQWLLSIYEPVYDKSNQCQCYAAVDISLDHINQDTYKFLARVISLFFGFFVIVLAVAIWLAEYNVILPINSMAMEANRSSFDTEEARARTIRNIEKLDIRTQDEIENLYTAMIRTTKGMAETTDSMAKAIAETQRQNALIGKMQNGLILVLADMVESRDQNTGEHVRKTAAYTGVIMRELKKEHIYEDQLTDEFIQDVMNSAPLHDVGKIQVPDQILNKAGKLTDEEFATMKKHTTAGAEIISSAMDMVSEGGSGYLKEARNLAHFHHEKWNGKGYPMGLKGEEIPLSARIMAVADVFDALVSKRSYKNAFTFEKAMDIIREGVGSHFDPNVAGAFINAQDEVREIMNSQMMGRDNIGQT